VNEARGSVELEIEDLAPGETRAVQAGGHEILICNVGGELHAIANRCTHAKVELTHGQLFDCEIECPVHGARFDVRTGEVKSRPARRALRSYPVKRTESGVEITLSEAD
jgi:3-phenylpropionate/trans-cinnamate dioxygenase ferredoxin subunit